VDAGGELMSTALSAASMTSISGQRMVAASAPVERAIPPRTPVAEQRVSWRISPSGEHIACILIRPGVRPSLEVRKGGNRNVHEVPFLGPSSQILLDDDGHIMLCHHRESRHFVERIDDTGAVVAMMISDAQGFALINSTFALEYDRSGTSRLARIDTGTAVELVRFDGAAVGAVLLDNDRIAVNVLADGHCAAVLVDAGKRSVEPFVNVSDRSSDQVVDYAPTSQRLVIATDATGDVRLGVGRPELEPITFPQALSGPGSATHLATSAAGDLVAVAFEVGARSEIRLLNLASGELTVPDLPPLVVLGRGALTDTELVVPVSCPDRPATVLRIDISSWQHRFDDERLPLVAASRVGQLPGLDDLECVMIGDAGTADTVVVALHGGPLSAWRAMFDPFLAELAAAGIAVIAPNIRGSVGYGRAHWSSIVGDWGGPDLDDVLAVAATIATLRPAGARRPIVLGISYGAYLAMLAAQRDPLAWSACVALSPFVSGKRLLGDTGPIADLVRRLGGDTAPDLRGGLTATAGPVLLIHGTEDDVIPVAESALLHTELRAARRRCTFRPLAGAGHDLLTGPFRSTVTQAVAAFCRHVNDGPEIPADDQLDHGFPADVEREEVKR
jgi:pimeloyl-ACP methyl ester carboxylesterase